MDMGIVFVLLSGATGLASLVATVWLVARRLARQSFRRSDAVLVVMTIPVLWVAIGGTAALVHVRRQESTIRSALQRWTFPGLRLVQSSQVPASSVYAAWAVFPWPYADLLAFIVWGDFAPGWYPGETGRRLTVHLDYRSDGSTEETFARFAAAHGSDLQQQPTRGINSQVACQTARSRATNPACQPEFWAALPMGSDLGTGSLEILPTVFTPRGWSGPDPTATEEEVVTPVTVRCCISR